MPSGSFTFCDTDISSLGLSYAPEISDTFVYRPAEAQSHIETFDSHNGGYYYGSWSGPKDFTLRCFFEETNIDRGIMERVYALFKVGRSGKLIFSRRPWCYYYATVTEPIQTDFTNYLNGVITITMKAMYPFARSDVMTSLRTDPDYDMLMVNSAVFDKEGMEPATTYEGVTQTTYPILLMNPGTERAALGLSISGDVGEGIIVSNATTGQRCKMIAITPTNTTNANKTVIVDPISGKTVLSGNGAKELAFMFHEYGFLELEPSYPALRQLRVMYENDTTTITVGNILNDDYVGQYIFVSGKWNKINAQPDKHTLIVQNRTTAASTVGERTMIVRMNEIYITPDSSMNINISFIYKPTYA